MSKTSLAPVKPGMQDRTDSNLARQGAAKKVQTSFATKPGMRSRIGEVAGIKGGGFDGAPDASSPNPLAKEAISKGFEKPPVKWGMKDANGNSVNHELGQKVLDEAELAVQYSGDSSRRMDAAK